ncbi:unnamed protein product [Heterobilharzia americana]|nr:unnamed protein product [Heterobilharzia americana]
MSGRRKPMKKLRNSLAKGAQEPNRVAGLSVLSRLKALKDMDLQILKSPTTHPGTPLARLNCYQRISCNTLMVDGFQANKLKRPTHRHLCLTSNHYNQVLPPWNNLTNSLTIQNNSNEQEDESLEELLKQQQQQKRTTYIPSLQSPPPALSLSSASSSSTLYGFKDTKKTQRKCRTASVTNLNIKSLSARCTAINNADVTHQKSCYADNNFSNHETVLSSEIFTLLNKNSRSEERKLVSYERMFLTNCPVINSNEICCLLSLQCNRIHRIENLQHMTKLVYLNISENQLTSISGLETLYSLRILLLGQNQIKRICSLDNLYNLNVLDLNHNQIRTIEKLSHLTKLRSLDLSFNYITSVNGLSGLTSLIELNLRQNNILRIEPIENVPKLTWIFLSFNHIEKWSQVSGLAGLNSFAQVTLDGNPIASDPVYHMMISNNRNNLNDNHNFHHSGLITCENYPKSIVPISSSSENEEYSSSGPQLTAKTVVYSLSNHLKKMTIVKTMKVILKTMQERQNYQNGSNRVYLTEETLNENKSDISQFSTPQPTSSTSTIYKESEDEGGMMENSDNTPDDNSENNGMICSKSIGTLTNESFLFLSNQLTNNSLLKFTYHFDELSHLIIEGCLSKKVARKSTVAATLSWNTNTYKNHADNVNGVDSNNFEVNHNISKNKTSNQENVYDDFFQLISALQNLELNNNFMSSISGDNMNHPMKLSSFNQIHTLTIRHVNWNIFAKCIPTIHKLLPDLKELNLESNGLKYLHQILDLMEFGQLNALRIHGSDGNPIVEQAGRLWRPFIIWSLGDILKLSFLDGELIEWNETNESEKLFSSFYDRLQMRNPHYMTKNQIIHRKLKNKLKSENNTINMDNISLNDTYIPRESIMLNTTTSVLNTTGINENHNTCTLNNINVAITTAMTNKSNANNLNSLTQQNLASSNKWIDYDHMKNEDSLADSLNNLSLQFKTNENSMNEAEENKNNIIHDLSEVLKQPENIDNSMQQLDEKLSRQNYLMKIWPSILRRLVHRAMADNDNED